MNGLRNRGHSLLLLRVGPSLGFGPFFYSEARAVQVVASFHSLVLLILPHWALRHS